MLVATFSLEASPAFICVFFLLATIGYITFINVGSKWLTKVVNDFRESRRPQVQPQFEPALHQTEIGHNVTDKTDIMVAVLELPIQGKPDLFTRQILEIDSNLPDNEKIRAVLLFWVTAITSITKTSPDLISTFIKRLVQSADEHFEGDWFCELDRRVFCNSNLSHLLEFVEQVVLTKSVRIVDNDTGNVLIYFYPITTDEPAH